MERVYFKRRPGKYIMIAKLERKLAEIAEIFISFPGIASFA